MLRLIPRIAAFGAALLLMSPLAQAQMAAPAGQAPAPATAALNTATLANLCSVSGESGDAAVALGYCRGFIVGVGQYNVELTRPGGAAPIFCLPTPSPSLEAVQAAFVTWAAANPQFGQERAVNGLLRWAASAYPCAAPRRAAR